MNHTPASLTQRQANAKTYHKRRRAETKCKHGHSNWGRRKDNNRRYCITCKVERTRKYRKEKQQYKPLVTSRGKYLTVVPKLTFEERQLLKQKVSDIQTAREKHVRRMWVNSTYGERVNLGGEARPEHLQTKGYPTHHQVDKQKAA